jgi:HK97 family phage portal protein
MNELNIGKLRISWGTAKAGSLGLTIGDAGSGQVVNRDLYEDYSKSKLYTVLPTFYAGVYAIASSMASVPFRVYRRRNGKEVEAPDHELQTLLDTWNGWKSTYDEREESQSFLELTGSAYLLCGGANVDKGGKPLTLTNLRPFRVKVIKDATMGVAGYVYEVDSKRQTFSANEIVPMHYFNPTDDHYGLGAVDPASLAAICDLYAIALQKNFFKHDAQLGVVLEYPEDTGQDVLDRAILAFNEKHQGVDKAWRARAVAGAKVSKTSADLADMLFPDLRRFNREEILMALGVPPVMVTLLDGATYANAKEQKRQFWELTIIPKLKKWEGAFNLHLAPRYGNDITVRADLAGIEALRPDRVAMVSAITQALPLLRRDEARAWLNDGELPSLKPLGGELGNEVLQSFSLIPASALSVSEQKPAGAAANADLSIERLLNAVNEKAAHVLSDEQTEARKVGKWRAFDKRSRMMARVFEKTARSMFKEQESAVLDGLESAINAGASTPVVRVMLDGKLTSISSPETKSVAEVSLILDRLQNGNIERFRGVYAEAVNRAGTNALEDLGLTELQFSLLQPSVVSYLDKAGAQLVKGVDATTKDRLATTLAEGIQGGENMLQLSDRVKTVFDATRARANAIAVTESGAAYNAGTLEAWTQTGGIVEKKVWLSSRDDRVRETHADADGQEVPLSGVFQVGDATLAFPGDGSSQDPGETVNCRCTIEAVLSGEQESYRARRNGNGTHAHTE